MAGIVKGKDIKLNVQPVTISIYHEYVFEGPCRFGEGEQLTKDYDLMRIAMIHKGFVDEVQEKLGSLDFINIMEPIVIKRDETFPVTDELLDEMGKDAAEYVIDKVGTEGTVVVLDVPTSGSVAELRKKGFTETMAAEAPNMVLKEYATEFTREAGLSDMADILTANPQIDAVFSMDDETSIGALQAIRDAGRTDIKVITGVGGCQEWFNMMLVDENQDIWLQSDLYSPVMVEDAVDMALDILNGNAPENPVKIIPTERVDRENAADYLDENSPY